MSTQHNSEIAIEAYSLLLGKCPKGCEGKLLVIPEDLEKRRYALAKNLSILQKCRTCGFTAKIPGTI